MRVFLFEGIQVYGDRLPDRPVGVPYDIAHVFEGQCPFEIAVIAVPGIGPFALIVLELRCGPDAVVVIQPEEGAVDDGVAAVSVIHDHVPVIAEGGISCLGAFDIGYDVAFVLVLHKDHVARVDDADLGVGIVLLAMLHGM